MSGNLHGSAEASPRPVRRPSTVALDAVQPHPESARPAFRGGDPRPLLPRRVVADVLVVPALQLGNPMSFHVLVEPRDPTPHRHPSLRNLMKVLGPSIIQASNSWTTLARVTPKSVRVSSRPSVGNVNRVWSRPSACNRVACR